MRTLIVIASMLLLCLSAEAQAGDTFKCYTTTFPSISNAAKDSIEPPSLYEVGHTETTAPRFWPLRIIYDNPRKAARFYDIVGFSALTVGAVLRGKAEHHRMHHGTSGDYDNFHITRDAGLVLTGIGAASLGTATACNVLDWEKGRWAVILNRAIFGLLVSRLVAEGTYMAMD